MLLLDKECMFCRAYTLFFCAILEDILPQFKMYVAVKKGYQLKELTAEDLKFAMRSMCRDIEEFFGNFI